MEKEKEVTKEAGSAGIVMTEGLLYEWLPTSLQGGQGATKNLDKG